MGGASMNPMMQNPMMSGMNAMRGMTPTNAAATGNPMINAIMGKAANPVPTQANNMNSVNSLNSMSSLSTNQIMPKAGAPSPMSLPSTQAATAPSFSSTSSSSNTAPQMDFNKMFQTIMSNPQQMQTLMKMIQAKMG